MKAETNFLPNQPLTHVQNNKECSEVCFCQDYSLNQSQLQRYYALKAEANILWEHQERWDLISTLYTEYFQEPPKKSGKQWMRLGFQGLYPETDFRGGGILSLQLILKFVKRNRPLVQIMEQDKAGFFFAITAINIAFFMKKYFHLADFELIGKETHLYCSRRALKNFCKLLIDIQSAFFQIHEMMLKYFYSSMWVPASRDNSQTLLQFNDLFDNLKTRLKSTFENYTLQTLGDFKERFTSL